MASANSPDPRARQVSSDVDVATARRIFALARRIAIDEIVIDATSITLICAALWAHRPAWAGVGHTAAIITVIVTGCVYAIADRIDRYSRRANVSFMLLAAVAAYLSADRTIGHSITIAVAAAATLHSIALSIGLQRLFKTLAR